MAFSPRLLDEGFRALLEAAPDAMVLTDERGEIVLVNAQAERLFGYARGELVGRPIEILVPPRFRAAHVGERTTYAERPRTRPMGAGLDLHAVRKDNTEFPAEISLSPLPTAAGQLVVSAIRDISDRRVAEAERARLLKEHAGHQAADRIRDEFLATLSHELRTPLNAILGWVALARTRALDPELQRALAIIHRNARMQVQLVEDLLDISRVVAGKLRLDLAALDFADVCDAALDVIRPAAEAKELQLHTSYESRPLLMMGDPDRLQQVVWNLLANAVKFTERGGRVDLNARRTDEGTIRLIVRDTGKGIPSAFLPHVFDRFRQEDSTSTRGYGGLGIGLSITQSLVEAHGGTISVASSGEGQGSTFAVTLPARAALPRENGGSAAGHSPAPEEPDLKGLRILVVDDQPDERELLSEVLKRHGAQVATAASAAQAFSRVKEFAPHVLVSDIAMPGQDGHVLLRRIRQMDPPLGRIPAIAVTAHARGEERDLALAAGFQDYMPKPIDFSKFVRRVAKLAAIRFTG